MNLQDISIRDMLPQFMRNDTAIRGFAKSTDDLTRMLANKIKTMSTWDVIDQLPESELDRLAEELNVLWYRNDATITTKRQLIKESDKVYMKLGTKWAVENVVTAYFGDGYIKEWYQYDGEPGRFRIYTANPQVTNELLNEFMDILEKVKRKSAHLDSITITLTGEMKLHTGVGYMEISVDTIPLGINI